MFCIDQVFNFPFLTNPFVLGSTDPLSRPILLVFLLDSNNISSSLSDSELTRLPSVASARKESIKLRSLKLLIVIKIQTHV